MYKYVHFIFAHLKNSKHDLDESELETAKSWIEGAGDPGVNPSDVKCENIEIKEVCNVFNYEWLSACEGLVTDEEISNFVNSCEIDLCEFDSAETRKNIFSVIVEKCQSRTEDEILCDWQTKLTGEEPLCGKNEVYKGNG